MMHVKGLRITLNMATGMSNVVITKSLSPNSCILNMDSSQSVNEIGHSILSKIIRHRILMIYLDQVK